MRLTITQALQKAFEALKSGKFQEAERLYKAIVKIHPKHPDANHNLGMLFMKVGKVYEALTFLNTAIEASPRNAQHYLSYIEALLILGLNADAKAIFDRAKRNGAKGEEFDKLEDRLMDAGQIPQEVNPIFTDPKHKHNKIRNNLKVNQAIKLKKPIDKDDALEKAKNTYHDIPNHFPKTHRESDRPRKVQDPPADQLKALVNIFRRGQLQQALTEARTLVEKFPQSAILFNILGVVLKGSGQICASVEAYNKALKIKPDYAEAYFNMGNALKQQGKLEQAIEAYKNALAITRDHAEASYNMGNALKEQGKLKEAIEAYKITLAIKPNYAEAYHNMGNALKDQGKLEEAIDAYKTSLAFKPNYESARVNKLYLQAHICDWDSISKDIKLLPQLGTIKEAISPFALLPIEDSPMRHLIRSKIYSEANYQNVVISPWAKPKHKPKRLKIGYFSADFHNHATMYLMSQIFTNHDSERFEISAFSYGPNIYDEMRQKVITDADRFYDVHKMNDTEIVELAQASNLDVAIDLKGYTKDARVSPFASRLAPVQISYLGYPGTLGNRFIDYIIADQTLIPEDNCQYYTEQIIYLPHTYQPTDNQRKLSAKQFTREQMGLPEVGFVLCCFNNNYKISPTEFDIWMRLLDNIEDSVLWLLKSNHLAQQNLKKEAQSRGIDPKRLVFAERMPHAEHLKRHQLADLFIDTFNCNAHTTASDALWAGLPVVTKMGQGFAARVAGSLLNAVGMPELITETKQQYEALIFELAQEPSKLAKVKAKLRANRLTEPLFNSELYTRHLESGYEKAYQTYLDGKPPETIIVPR